jgi:hypothetical protein
VEEITEGEEAMMADALIAEEADVTITEIEDSYWLLVTG